MGVVPVDPDNWTIEELRERAKELGLVATASDSAPEAATVELSANVATGAPRDPFGDTEDLGTMIAAGDKLHAAQDRLAKHTLPAVITDLGLQVVGALYVLAVSLLASALIVANCGGG